MSSPMSTQEPREQAAVSIAPIEQGDAAEVSGILFEAFRALYDYHRFPGAYPSLQFAAQIVRGLIAHPEIWGVAAWCDGRVVGSSFLDERGPVRAVGPVSVDPSSQARGVGRRLTEALLERAGRACDVRLQQDAFNRSSLSLYASLGFEVREPVVLLAGRPRSGADPRLEVRPLEVGDIEECERLCLAVHGFERSNELRDALHDPLCSPHLAIRDGEVAAYATTLSYFPAAYAVAASEADMHALVLGSAALDERPLSFLVPIYQGELFRWCLSERFRVIKPMTYMTIGDYRRPDGCWMPSVMY
jgi:GNAT superfamily N-acetyltransferase